MSLLSIVIGSVVFVYTVIYAIHRITPILHYNKSKSIGEINTFEGNIIKKTQEENKKVKGITFNLCFPLYEYSIKDEKKQYQSVLRYQDASIGQKAEIAFCERTGEAWIPKEFPSIKKEIIIRSGAIFVVLVLLVLTEIFL